MIHIVIYLHLIYFSDLSNQKNEQDYDRSLQI